MTKKYVKCGVCGDLIEYKKAVEITLIYPSPSGNNYKISCTCETCARAIEQVVNKYE